MKEDNIYIVFSILFYIELVFNERYLLLLVRVSFLEEEGFEVSNGL